VGEQRAIDTLQPVERELRFTLPYPERYIREVFGQGLDLLDFSPGGALDIQQDAVLFRKPGPR
jgi:hypothetical protein